MVANKPCTLADICAEALTWTHTPYHHHACLKGVGVDCAMLLVGIARNVALIAPDWVPDFYTPQWHLHQTGEQYVTILESQGATKLALDVAQPGHILLFRWQPTQPASHAAILMPEGKMLHAFRATNPRYGRVRHEAFNPFYRRHLAYAYTWPGVTDE